ncbi:hypothetical protein EES38_21420 [Vibrio viridaestus]|uniref:Uncharacterized protein n=1 Tax=Vibrio viridaestus TaxID=2487322 RepID=A0A3N9TC47_9VIBR|nr:hypothetical protein EES38_21420 [Vibrio viridaestus]
MDFEIYLPCEPDWICEPLLIFFGLIFAAMLLILIVLIIKEHRKIKAHSLIVKRRLKRRMHPRSKRRR